MAVNTSDIITDNTVEELRFVGDDIKCGLVHRHKVNGSRPDSVIPMNPKEARKVMVDIRDWLDERFK